MLSCLSLTNTDLVAIAVAGCLRCTIADCLITSTVVSVGDNIVGIYVNISDNATIVRNTVTGFQVAKNFTGVLIYDSDEGLYVDNLVENVVGSVIDSSGTGVAIGFDIQVAVGTATGNRVSRNKVRNVLSLDAPPVAVMKIDSGIGSVIANNRCIDNGNLIDRGNCESTAPPSMTGESTAVKTGCTFARSTDFAHNGTYSYKMSKTAAPGTAARVDLGDSTAANDLHGATVGLGHTHSGYLMIPSVNGPQASEVSIVLQDTTAGAWSSAGIFATTDYYDTWQAVTVTRTIGTTCAAGGFLPSLAIAAAASSSEYVYWDDLRLRPDGVNNEYGQNFSDAGTGTQQASDSWNAPFQV
jgi:hypothetical protein